MPKFRESGFIGVRPTGWGTYRATIWNSESKLRVNLGTFTSAEEAAREYDRYVLQRDGEKAKLNFPPEDKR